MPALQCELCGQELGVSMTTDLRNGDTIVVGEQCLVTYALTMAATVTEGMPPELAEQYGSLFASIASHGPQPISSSATPAATPARGKRRASPADGASGVASSTTSEATSDASGLSTAGGLLSADDRALEAAIAADLAEH